MSELSLVTLEPRIREAFSRLDGLDNEYHGEGKYRRNSPRRPGADGHSFSLKVDRKGITWLDHNEAGSGPISGNLFDLERILGIADEPGKSVPLRVCRASSTAEANDLAEYVAQHAGSEIFWRNARWQECTYNNKPALSFQTSNGTRYRLLGGGQKYASPAGYRRCWYRLDDAIAYAESTDGPLVLCNGEASVVSAQAYGVPAAAIAGGTEKSSIPEELVAELKTKWSGPIIIAMDCDEQGRKAGPALAEFLRKNDFDARAVDMGLADKNDLADYVRIYQGDTLSHLKALPDMAAPPGVSRFLSSDDVDALPESRPMPGLPLFDETGIALLYGQGSSFKTFVALRWAHNVAEHVPVLYVAAEGVRAICRRKKALDQLYGKRTNLWFREDLNLFDKRHISEIEAFGKWKGVKLIILDTLNRVAIGTKEDTEDYGKLLGAVGQLEKRLHCLVLALHHTPRGSKNPRGGTVLEFASDFGYLQEVETKGWRKHKAVTLTNMRNRTHELRPNTLMVLVPVDLEDNRESTLVAMTEAEAEAFTGSTPEALTSDMQEILKRLREADTPLPSTKLWKDNVRPDGIAHTQSTGPKLLERMVQRGLLVKDAKGVGRAATYSLASKAAVNG